MAGSTPIAAQGTDQKSKASPPLRLPKPVRWLREVLAFSAWALAITHLLVADLSTLITGSAPILESILHYRLLVGLGCIAAFWILLGNRIFILFFGYILAYPFVLLLWTIPKFAFRNWAVAIAFSPAIHSILTTFRASFVLFTTALIASFAVCLANESAVVALGMFLTGGYLIVHYIRRFRVAFSPSTVFADVGGAVRKAWDAIRESTWAARPEGDPQSERYQQQFGQSLLQMYMTTVGLHFLAARLKEVIESRKLDLYFIGSLVYTFALTTVIFGVEYFGLERLYPGSFTGVDSPGLMTFIGYSFSTIMTSDISPLKPSSDLAQLLSYFQLFGSLLIIVLLVFVVLTSIRERYRQDLGVVVEELGAAADRATVLIEENYELTIASAEAWLLEHNAQLARWLLRLRYGEERAKQIPGYSEPAV